MKTPRSGAGAARLLDGTVFIIGGYNGSYLNSGEIYNPATGEFTTVDRIMSDARHTPTVTPLDDGKVLITGGFNGQFLESAEIYDTFSLRFSDLAPMSYARDGHTATLLRDGTVLIAGGCSNAQTNKIICDKYIDTAEIYDPDPNSENEGFSKTGKMRTARVNHTATLLPDGRVLIAGGRDDSGPLASAEIYDPETGLFTAIGSMGVARSGHTPTAAF
jgi:hypothetical protein